MARLLSCILALVWMSGAAFGDGSQCRLARYAALPIAFDSFGRVMVPISIADTSVSMVVDTGATFSLLDRYTVHRLKLVPGWLPGGAISMIFGGQLITTAVKVPKFRIARLSVDDHFFPLMQDGPPLTLPEGGALGTDIIAGFDLDFDFAGGKLNLISQDHCKGSEVYWASNYAAVPFKMGNGRHINIDVALDGQKVQAIVDTGAAQTVMSLEVAEHMFGLDGAALEKQKDRQTFKTLSLQGIAVINPLIFLVPDKESKLLHGEGRPDMILGMDVLRQLHLYIAYKEHMIYATAAEPR